MPENDDNRSIPAGSSSSEREHPRIDAIKEKAHEEKTVHGHVMPMANIFKLVGLAAFLIVMAIAIILIWPYIKEIFEPNGLERVLEDVRNAGLAGVFILLALQFLQIVVAFIPGEAVQMAAGILYGPWFGAIVILIGCIISSAFVYVIVKKLGAPFMQAMVPDKYAERITSFEHSSKFDAIVFILFLIPGLPKDVFTYIIPLTEMRLGKFLLLSNVARIPGIVVSTYAADGIVDGRLAESIIIFVVMALIAIVCLFAYNKIMSKRDEATESKNGED